jgi:hypothetical protein
MLLLLYNLIKIKLTIKPNNKLRIVTLVKNKIKESKLGSYYPLYPEIFEKSFKSTIF